LKQLDSISFAPAHMVDALNRAMAAAAQAEVLLQTGDDSVYTGRHVGYGGSELLNFGCCSYLGLELRPELVEGTIAAVRRFGTQFPFPRAMLQCPLYVELETALEEITGGYVAVAASTSLAHISALPVIVAPGEHLIVDQFAHASVHTAVALLRNVNVQVLRHSRLDILEKMIERAAPSQRKTWYVLDGLYSMLGEFAPIDHLAQLLERFPTLHLYVDDAHSTSWIGQYGRGYALDRFPNRDRVVCTLSLNKAFSAAGGAIVFSDKEEAMRVRRSGGPMAFSGAIQPPMLGAAVASARLHLMPELAAMQRELAERIALVGTLANQLGVPLASTARTPIFFVPCGPDATAFALTRAMRASGICVCPAMFPIVPINHAGVRFTITRHNTEDDIHRLMRSLAIETKRLELGRALACNAATEE
jgi:7-keto-8-aminopelargonate synthetase-like enzyme